MADTAAPDTSGVPEEEAPVISAPKPKPVPEEVAPRPSREKKAPARFEGQEEEDAPESPKPPSAKRKKTAAADESTSSRTKKPTMKKKEADEPSGDEEEPKKKPVKKAAAKKAAVKEKDTTKYCCGKTYDNKQPYIGCSSVDACKGNVAQPPFPPSPPPLPLLPPSSSPPLYIYLFVKGVEWFHVKCVGLNEKSAKKLSDWYCEACKEGEEGLGETDFDLVCRHADTDKIKQSC
jgi:hypothetical protein